MKILIGKATKEQLRAYATQTLGLEITPNAGLETLRARVKALVEGDEIVLAAPPEPTTDEIDDLVDDGQSDAENADPDASEVDAVDPGDGGVLGTEETEPEPVMASSPSRRMMADSVSANQQSKRPPVGYARVLIAMSGDIGGRRPVELGVNGRLMLVPRGRPVNIPIAYFEVLKNAVTFRYEPLVIDGMDRGLDPVPQQIRLYPYQLIAINRPAKVDPAKQAAKPVAQAAA